MIGMRSAYERWRSTRNFVTRSSGRLTANAPSANACLGDMIRSSRALRAVSAQLGSRQLAIAPDRRCAASGRVEQLPCQIVFAPFELERSAPQSVAVQL